MVHLSLAETTSGNGGNIQLTARDILLLRRDSQISATAGTSGGGGNGGNIDIDTNFLVAISDENSDITANAAQGRGGNVNITASDIFGIQARERPTPLSDITASSDAGPQLNGIVEINRPDFDPNQGLVILSVELVDASDQIAASCASGGESVASNEFIITGRGGLPPNPREPLGGEAVLTNWASLMEGAGERDKGAGRNQLSAEEASQPTDATTEPLVEATGWVIGSKGEVILTASAPSVTLDIPWLTPTSCHRPQIKNGSSQEK